MGGRSDPLVRNGHTVLVERGAGAGASFDDGDYQEAGATLVGGPEEVFDWADLVVKVKEPQPQEYEFFREGQVLFTFLHLAPAPELTQALLAARVTGIAYETVQEAGGNLPLLYPMSEIAGTLASQVATRLLQNISGGPGKLMGGVPGTGPSYVVVVGGGTVGLSAARMAAALGADVAVFDIDLDRLRYIDQVSHGVIKTLYSTPAAMAGELSRADVVVGAVHIPGAKTPKVIASSLLGIMRKGTIVMDVAIDQGGSVEGARPTTHSHPTYPIDGITLYAVPNMPGIVANTSSLALSNATYPYVLRLANLGLRDALARGEAITRGVNTLGGHVTHRAVADALDVEYVPVAEALAG